MRGNCEGHRHKSDQFAVDLGLHSFAGNVDSRGSEKCHIFGVLRDSAKRDPGKVPYITKPLGGVNQTDFKIWLVHSRPGCDGKITAVMRRFTDRSKGRGVPTSIHFDNKAGRFPFHQGFYPGIPEGSFPDTFLKKGSNALHNGGVCADTGHQEKISSLMMTFGRCASDVNASKVFSSNHVRQPIQLAWQFQFTSNDICCAPRPDG